MPDGLDGREFGGGRLFSHIQETVAILTEDNDLPSDSLPQVPTFSHHVSQFLTKVVKQYVSEVQS